MLFDFLRVLAHHLVGMPREIKIIAVELSIFYRHQLILGSLKQWISIEQKYH